MNTVHHKLFRKKKILKIIKLNKNQIKLDNIFKNEIFENKIFVENNILNAKLIALHYL